MRNPEKNASNGSENTKHSKLEKAATSSKGRGKQPKGVNNSNDAKATKKVAKKSPNSSSIAASMNEMEF